MEGSGPYLTSERQNRRQWELRCENGTNEYGKQHWLTTLRTRLGRAGVDRKGTSYPGMPCLFPWHHAEQTVLPGLSPQIPSANETPYIDRGRGLRHCFHSPRLPQFPLPRLTSKYRPYGVGS